MSIKLRKESSDSAVTPRASHVTLFADSLSGGPALKSSDGSIRLIGGYRITTVNWKDGIPGNPYVDGDTAVAAAGEMVMVLSIGTGVPQVVDVQFPSAATVVGELVMVNNLHDKQLSNPGIVNFIPASGESIGAGAVGEIVTSVESFLVGCVTFVSDGNGIWHPINVGGPELASPVPV